MLVFLNCPTGTSSQSGISIESTLLILEEVLRLEAVDLYKKIMNGSKNGRVNY